MKKLYELNKELEKLQKQKKKYISIENVSLFEFIKYKRALSKIGQVKNKIREINLIKLKAENKYNSLTQSWIDNPNINCRKYYKMERKAKYKKDKTLYKLGILRTHPMKNFIKENEFVSKIYSKCQKYNFFKKINPKIKNLVSNIIPQKINNFAIFTAKKCISGYRLIDQDVKYFMNKTFNNKPIQYFKYIKEEAVRQLDSKSAHMAYAESLNPKNFEQQIVRNTYIKNKNPIVINKLYDNEKSRGIR